MGQQHFSFRSLKEKKRGRKWFNKIEKEALAAETYETYNARPKSRREVRDKKPNITQPTLCDYYIMWGMVEEWEND